MSSTSTQPKQWTGKVPSLDDFGNPIAYDFIDGRTKEGPWAIMSLVGHNEHGIGLGAGIGQHYRHSHGNVWLKVGG